MISGWDVEAFVTGGTSDFWFLISQTWAKLTIFKDGIGFRTPSYPEGYITLRFGGE